MRPQQMTLDFLPKDTQLLAAIKPEGELPSELVAHLVKNVQFASNGSLYLSFSGQFTPITLNENLTITFSVPASGSVQKKLNKCQCSSPALSGKTFPSLKSILQAISEVYEPQRASHGGKVYDYVFFHDQDGIWKPLEILREKLYLPLAP